MSQSPPKKYKRKMMLFANNGGVNSRTALLDGAPFKAQLTKSLVLNAGTGSPTYTRATTATFTDFEGVMRTAIAGEARFQGARRVRNCCVNSGTLTAAGGWSVSNATSVIGATDPEGGTTAYTLTATAPAGFILRAQNAAVIGDSLLNSWYIRRVTGTGAITFYGDTGAEVAVTSSVTSAWSRVTDGVRTATGTNQYIGIKLATSGDVVEIWHPQGEITTSQTTKTTPSEYVSVGVLSSPWHGAGVDGVKYFSTFLNNTPISSSTAKYASLPGVAGSYFSTPDSAANSITGDIDIRVCAALVDWTPATESVLIGKWDGAAKRSFLLTIQTNGVPRLYGSTNGSASWATIPVASTTTGFADGTANWIRVTRNATTGATNFYTSTNGVVWTQLGTADVTSTSGAIYDSDYSVEVGTYAGGTLLPAQGRIYQAQIYNGINGTLAVNFNANDYRTGATWAASSTGETWTINGGATIFGAGASAPFDATGPKGYLSEGSRQNICLQSNALTTAPWVAGNIAAPSQNATGVDGATSAWTVTASAGNTSHVLYQPYTGTASAYTNTKYLKQGTARWAGLGFGGGTTVDGAFFDLQNGVVGTVAAGTTATITPAANGFYRCSVTKTLTAATWYIQLEPHTADNQSTTWNAAGTETIIVTDAQAELGSAATTYIPTTTVAVTRNADILSYPSSGNLGATAVWVYAEHQYSGSPNSLAIVSASAATYGAGNGWMLRQVNTGATTFGGNGTTAPSAAGATSGVNKVAGSGNTVGTIQSACVNGGTVTSNATWDWTGVGTVSINIGNLNQSTELQHSFGTIRNVRISTQALSAAQLASITS